MNARPWICGILLLAVALPTGGMVAAQSDADEPMPDVGDGPSVWLEGPFGRVAGGDPQAPAGASPGNVALDTFVRDAPLSLVVDVPFEDLISVDVVARQPSEAAFEQVLSSGATTFDGPAAPGGSVIVATLETSPFGTTEHAWLVDVPDREHTPEALFEITAPRVELIADASSVVGAPGDGCYLYFCADVGKQTPAAVLDPLRVGVGETLAIRTDDGSGLAGWTGRLTPLDGTAIDGVESEGALTDTVESMLGLSGLEAPSAGEWLLEVRVVFDRERGHQWQFFRVDAR